MLRSVSYFRIVLCLAGFLDLNAQSWFYMPAVHQINQLSSLIAPSVATQGKLDIRTSAVAFSPPFANVGNLLAIGSVGFRQDSSGVPLFRHRVGVFFVREKEGEYLSRYRAYGSYVYTQPLSTRWSASLGIYGGLYQYLVASTISTGTQKATAGDATLGLSARTRAWEITLSSNQLFASQLRGDLPNSYLRRTWNGLLSHQRQWSARVKQDVQLWYSQGDVNSTFLSLQSQCWYTDHIYAGLGLRTHQSGMLYSVGIQNSSQAEHRLLISGSYFVPFRSRVVYASPQVEFCVSWSWR